MRGRSHVVNINRGVDSESEKNKVDKFRLLSLGWFISGRHAILIIKLCIVGLIQTMLLFDIHTSGINIIVGTMIFNIEEY